MGKQKNTGLGKALIRQRFNGKRHAKDGEQMYKHTTDFAEPMNTMQSITHENDLDAFLHTAQLAGTEFKAEKLNVTVITPELQNPFLLSPEKEKEILESFENNKSKLTIPRRPKWDKNTTASELQQAERENFLNWRRGLAQLEENNGLLLTPYERNLEIWRQLWRVVEKSDLIVQIVDARNPLIFRSEDLERYVKENGEEKKNLLLINKADMLTINQRMQWADYFQKNNIEYVFFSAKIEKDYQDLEKEKEKLLKERLEQTQKARNEIEEEEIAANAANQFIEDEIKKTEHALEDMHLKNEEELKVPKIARIYSAEDLVNLLLEKCPFSKHNPEQQIIGLVGYPNVGKSSTINAVTGAKKVAVGSTPGKTKHFQTIHLSQNVILCDCPGLVFPSFATTQAEMVCNGILPVDQLREYTGPVGLLCRHIPREVLEAFYGIRIKIKDENEEGYIPRPPTSEEFLCPYAINRGFTKSVQGNPDEARAARYVLKDYTSGKLLYCHPPPDVDAQEFNKENFDISRYIKDRAKFEKFTQQTEKIKQENKTKKTSSMAKEIDREFFQGKTVVAHTKGKFSSSDFTRANLYSQQQTALPRSKKHNKGNKKTKARNRFSYADDDY
jgi:large subunit GTPase 1